MALTLTFLGTGTSFGVPVIGCRCPNCTSEDPRDRRSRHGAVVNVDGRHLLVDTPPELRLQLLAAGIEDVSDVWFTHAHADHVHGIDDLRVFSAIYGTELTAWVHEGGETELLRRFPYIFDPSIHPAEGTTSPELRVRTFREEDSPEILGRTFTPLAVPHGTITCYGFRVGGLGYVTDGKELPADTLERLTGVDVLVLNALWFGDPHPTHFNVEEAVEAAQRVGARMTYLTHLTHMVGHRELSEWLPEGIQPAFDGLTVAVRDAAGGARPRTE